MARVTQANDFEYKITSTIDAFFHTFQLVSILKRVGACKMKGIPTVKLFRELVALVFQHRTMFRSVSSNSQEIGKDVFYRFINSCRINWMRFTTVLAAKVVRDFIEPLTDQTRVNVFIVDDTPYERNRSKKVELLSRNYNHCEKVFYRGFRLLALGFSDGNTFIPVNSCLLSSDDRRNRFCEAGAVDKRTSGFKQRRLAPSSAPQSGDGMVGEIFWK